MTPIHSLFIVVEDLLYSSNMNINIIMPYWNKKKDIGPPLVKLLREVGLPRIKATPLEWMVLTDKGPKIINFTTRTSALLEKYSDNIIIPE